MAADVIAAASRLAGLPGRVVLLSGREADGLGQLSVVAADPELVVSGGAGEVRVTDRQGRVQHLCADPFEALEAAKAARPAAAAIGYLGYDIGAAAAGADRWPADCHREPALWFGLYGAHWVFDHTRGVSRLEGSDDEAIARLTRRQSGTEIPLGPLPSFGALSSDARVDGAYRAGFAAVKEYLAAGDCYQVNLSRRLSATVASPGDPLALFERLCERNPEPYAAFIETPRHVILSGSPERFLYRAAGTNRLETRPIKGTRERTGDRDRDARALAELEASEKERAEHLMIVDLERNDLGRLAVTGSVVVEELMAIATLPTLFHMVSTVSCELRPGVGLAKILAATFPGGSITGAPKRRSMEIIRELEPGPRGVYTGAIGLLGPSGQIDLSIAIRTAVLCENSLSLHVGGGLVADSVFERELTETEEKAAGWRRALHASDDAVGGHHVTVRER